MNDQQRAAMQMALETIETLWDIIDDIDTYGDMAKADEKLYRSLVERKQRERFKTGITTDGYTLNDGAITALREALAQPQGEWVDLTPHEVTEQIREGAADGGWQGFAQRITAKFKEKNTPKVVPQGAPVAWMRENEDCTDCFVWERDEEHTIPLYTTPPSVEAAIEATKEKAAKVCDAEMDDWAYGGEASIALNNCAAAIRAMK